MSFVDDDLVSAAVDYKPKGKRLSMPYRIGASIAAACMVLHDQPAHSGERHEP